MKPRTRFLWLYQSNLPCDISQLLSYPKSGRLPTSMTPKIVRPALIACADCGHPVSRSALTCPNCAAVLRQVKRDLTGEEIVARAGAVGCYFYVLVCGAFCVWVILLLLLAITGIFQILGNTAGTALGFSLMVPLLYLLKREWSRLRGVKPPHS
jgi:hypothetical protein